MLMPHYQKSLTCNAVFLLQTSLRDFKVRVQKFHLPAGQIAQAAAGSKLLVLATATGHTGGEKAKHTHTPSNSTSRSASKLLLKASALF